MWGKPHLQPQAQTAEKLQTTYTREQEDWKSKPSYQSKGFISIHDNPYNINKKATETKKNQIIKIYSIQTD